MRIGTYAKFIVAAVVAVGIVAVQTIISLLGDGAWTTEDTLVVVLAVLGAISVYAVPNRPYVKTEEPGGAGIGT